MASKKHAELIRAWLDGAQIQYLLRSMNRWVDTEKPNFEESEEFRIKPVEPERVYPKTQMEPSDLVRVWHHAEGGTATMLREVANDVLRHACNSGQIVTREEFNRAVGDRKARDMSVARAVDAWYAQTFQNKQRNSDNYLAELIKSVK